MCWCACVCARLCVCARAPARPGPADRWLGCEAARRGPGLRRLQQRSPPGSSSLPRASTTTKRGAGPGEGGGAAEPQTLHQRSRVASLTRSRAPGTGGPQLARPSARLCARPGVRFPIRTRHPGNTRDKMLTVDGKGYLGVKILASEDVGALRTSINRCPQI